MDFDRYCRHCGSKVELNDATTEYYCPCCEQNMPLNETMAGFKKDARITQLKAMHQLMCEANDESIYMSWVYTVPDCPSEEDFSDIAIDDKQYNEVFDKFLRLVAKPGNRY